jgi:subtilisin family serine protease
VKPQYDRTAVAVAAAALLTILQLTGPDAAAIAQVSLPPVNGPVNSRLDPLLRRSQDELDARTRRRVDEAKKAAEEVPDAVVTDEILETVDDTLEVAVETASTTLGTVTALARPFVADVDSNGWAIEKDVLVLLLDEQQLEVISQGNFDVIASRGLPSLGLTMITLRDPNRGALPQAAEDLKAALPGAAVDFNHIYRFASEDAGASDGTDEPAANIEDAGMLRIGMIDSAVTPEHFSLRDRSVNTSDFVSAEGERPFGHGTAVASLIARSAGDGVQLFAASVFFQTPNHAPGASTESLIAALDWLVAQRVDVINMSLSGPANTLLERAISNVTASGLTVVAAVGNNGPSGEALYPAAYDGVVGVTAIDRDKKIFRYANRGPHVDFAALGVNVKVADAGGGWRIESGTSMASPLVAVVVAQTLRSGQLPPDALFEHLSSHAEDLGKKGFDPVFGYGLLARPPLLVSGSSLH